MESKNGNRVYKLIMVILVTAIVTALITIVVIYNFFTNTNVGKQEILSEIVKEDKYALTDKLEYIKAYLEAKYVGKIDEDKMLESAIQGYVAGLDDVYTEYLTEEDYKSLLVSVTGNYVGIGIYMSQTIDGDIIVVEPIENSPAEEAGLKSGDIIVKVNGEECNGMDINVAASKIKGQEATKVKLEILRDKETFEIELERKKIEIEDIKYEMLDNNIAYIELMSFDVNCFTKFETYLNELIKKGAKSLIIDLRGNGGGVVSEAISLSELFISKDNIILKSYDKDNNETIIKSKKLNTIEIPVIVLVNENSASASEIFAAAMQDNNRAKIIGQTTYGKGCMQEIDPLSFGGALKITIEEFRSPNGNVINHVGITPDIQIVTPLPDEEDLQLKKAIELLK